MQKILEQNHMEVLILLVLLDCLFHSPPMLKQLELKSGGGYGNVIDVWVPSLGVQLRFAHLIVEYLYHQVKFQRELHLRSLVLQVVLLDHISIWKHLLKEVHLNYGGNMVPAPYVSLIRLTKAKIEGKKSTTPEMSNGSGGQSLNIEGGTTSRREVAQEVTPEKRKDLLSLFQFHQVPLLPHQ